MMPKKPKDNLSCCYAVEVWAQSSCLATERHLSVYNLTTQFSPCLRLQSWWYSVYRRILLKLLIKHKCYHYIAFPSKFFIAASPLSHCVAPNRNRLIKSPTGRWLLVIVMMAWSLMNFGASNTANTVKSVLTLFKSHISAIKVVGNEAYTSTELWYFYFQPTEDNAVKWSEKQKIEYTAQTPVGTKKGDWLPVTVDGLFQPLLVYLLCFSAQLNKCFLLCRHKLAIPVLVQSRVCGVQVVSVVGERGILSSRATCEEFRTKQRIIFLNNAVIKKE